jgi:hypothetical protein
MWWKEKKQNHFSINRNFSPPDAFNNMESNERDNSPVLYDSSKEQFASNMHLMYNGESGIIYPAYFVFLSGRFLPFTSFCDMDQLERDHDRRHLL